MPAEFVTASKFPEQCAGCPSHHHAKQSHNYDPNTQQGYQGNIVQFNIQMKGFDKAYAALTRS